MKNCLVTKLNATVNNDELLKLGELRVGIGSGPSSFINSTQDQHLKILSCSGVVSPSDDNGSVEVLGDTILVHADSGSAYGRGFYSSTNDCLVSIPNKYILTRLYLAQNSWGELNIDDLKYCDNLTTILISADAKDSLNSTGDISSVKQCTRQININYTNIHGDISGLAGNNYAIITLRGNTNIFGDISAFTDSSNLSSVDFNEQKNIYGNVSAFSSAIGITQINGYKSGISGSYESLVEGQCAAGRTSGTCRITTNKCTVNGSSAYATTTHQLVFSNTGASIIKGTNNPVTVATYTKSTGAWTYA